MNGQFQAEPEDWRHNVPAQPESVAPLTLWHGMTATWPVEYRCQPTFIGQFQQEQSDIYLYAVRFDLAEGDIEGFDSLDGHYLDYVVLEFKQKQPCFHRLTQCSGAVYSIEGAALRCVPALSLNTKTRRQLTVNGAPNWKLHDAEWPTLNDTPMHFLGQVALADNAFNRANLSVNSTSYLFCETNTSTSTFAIVEQQTHYQSIEEHYATE